MKQTNAMLTINDNANYLDIKLDHARAVLESVLTQLDRLNTSNDEEQYAFYMMNVKNVHKLCEVLNEILYYSQEEINTIANTSREELRKEREEVK